ncbi:hypothetical protein [Propionicimonas sp.]|uniref:hypothetical protein n=1 Tax=Propionicimonas sp. TaxID=1955623 RepID=UPI0039E220B6
MVSVAFSRATEEWLVLGEDRRSGPSGELMLVQEELSLVRAVDLKAALASWSSYYDAPTACAVVSDLPAAYFDADGPYGPISFEWAGDELVVRALHLAEYPDDEEQFVRSLVRLVEPYFLQHRCELRGIVNEEWLAAPYIGVELRVVVPWRSKSAADLFRVGEEVLRLCEAFSAGSVTRDTVAALVRGGGAGLLVGLPEGNWLDAKAEEYDLASLRGKVSLCQAVAKFCNGEDGGLIVIGARAKKVPGGEVIRSIRGIVPRVAGADARYRRIIDQHLYPPPLGLSVDVVPMESGRALIAIHVPPQPEELKPFLVQGAITKDGDVEGAFISIVQRRGEGSIPITAPMIHASLAAGRALLRGSSPSRGSR